MSKRIESFNTIQNLLHLSKEGGYSISEIFETIFQKLDHKEVNKETLEGLENIIFETAKVEWLNKNKKPADFPVPFKEAPPRNENGDMVIKLPNLVNGVVYPNNSSNPKWPDGPLPYYMFDDDAMLSIYSREKGKIDGIYVKDIKDWTDVKEYSIYIPLTGIEDLGMF